MKTDKPVKRKEFDEITAIVTKLQKRTRNAKARLLDLEIKTKDIDDLIERKVSESYKNKVQRLVLKACESLQADVQQNVLNKVESGYLNFINNLVESGISATITKNVRWKTKVFKNNDVNIKRLVSMYDKGWRIAFYGKLGNSQDEIVIMDKPKTKESTNKEGLK